MDVGVGTLHQTLVRTRTTHVSFSPKDSTPIKTRLPPRTPANEYTAQSHPLPRATSHLPRPPDPIPPSHTAGQLPTSPQPTPRNAAQSWFPKPPLPPRDHLTPHPHIHSLTPRPPVFHFPERNPTKNSIHHTFASISSSLPPPPPGLLNVPTLYQPHTISPTHLSYNHHATKTSSVKPQTTNR